MINTLDILFPLNRRTQFKDKDGNLVSTQQDVIYPDQGIALHYAEESYAPIGRMSVYTFDNDFIYVDSERNVNFDANGNPTEITAVQRYFPHAILAPCSLPEDGTISWHSTKGQYGYCYGDCYPATADPSTNIQHDCAVHSDGTNLWLDVDYFDHDAMIASFGFFYTINAPMLISIHDNLLNRTYTL